jgi:hypothetical protein
MAALLPADGIRLGLTASGRLDAVWQSGEVRVEIGAGGGPDGCVFYTNTSPRD